MPNGNRPSKSFHSYNVYCKISGLVKEADWEFWEQADFRPYIDIVVEIIWNQTYYVWVGLAGLPAGRNYEQVKDIAENYFIPLLRLNRLIFLATMRKTFYHLD